ncbi:MAG: TMEM175 family protein [Luteimonas sp.]
MTALLERGDRSTRLEAFIDAAFAFALTMMVIAGDRIPTSVDALVVALKSLPAYALSFLLIVRFWAGHVQWSRSYGLDDVATRRLSLLLIFLVLVFVYPMRMVFEALCNSLSGGYLPANFSAKVTDIPSLFITFSIAFGSLGAAMFLLYRHAWRLRDALGLSHVERVETRFHMFGWGLIPATALLSIVSALLIPARGQSGWWMGFPGYIYFSLNITAPLLAWRQRRVIAAHQRMFDAPT